MVDYVLEVYNCNTSNGTWTRIGEITTFSNLEWNILKNKPTYCNFAINVYSPDSALIQPFKNWILLKRNNVPYLFQITNVRGSLNADGGYLNVECNSIHYALNQLYVEGNYIKQNTDAGAIAVDLISTAQAKPYSNFGIQSGTIDTIGNTNETLFYQSIGKALTNQSDNIVGYIIDFMPILDANEELSYIQFNCFKTLGIYRSDLPPLELGFSVNELRFGMKDEVYNNIYTLGSGTNEVQVATSTNSTSQSIFGNRESVNKEANITVLSTLQKKGDTFLNVNQGIQLEVAFKLNPAQKPYFGDFGIYDILNINVNIENTFFNFIGTGQVMEVIIRYNNTDNSESVNPVIKYYKT